VLSTKIEFVAAPAVMVIGTFTPVMSSTENLFAPPLVFEFDTRVVFFEADRVEAEALVVDAVEAGADASLHDEVIGDDLVLDRGTTLDHGIGRDRARSGCARP